MLLLPLSHHYNIFWTSDNDDLDFEEDEDLAGVGNMSRKQYLEKLKKSDPEFYATMMQSSDLMDLNSSGEDESEEEERGGAIFEPPDKLEVCLALILFCFIFLQ